MNTGKLTLGTRPRERKFPDSDSPLRDLLPEVRGPNCGREVERCKAGSREFCIPRVENGTGKSRPDRLHLPSKPTVNRFRGKNRKTRKQNGKTGGNGNGNGWGVFPTVSRFLFSAGKIPAGIPVFVVVGCVTCVGNMNCCLHVLQCEL